jgi:hypothetical protein
MIDMSVCKMFMPREHLIVVLCVFSVWLISS